MPILPSPQIQVGLNLTELLIIILILSILTTLAIPSLLNHLQSLESKRLQHTLFNTLKLAKTHSFTYRQNVLLCLSDRQGQCYKNGQQELLLFVDKNNNKHFDISTDFMINKIALNLKYAKVYLRAGGRHHTKFFGDSGNPRGHMGHIKYCPFSSNSDLTYKISFNQTGRIVKKPSHSHVVEC